MQVDTHDVSYLSLLRKDSQHKGRYPPASAANIIPLASYLLPGGAKILDGIGKALGLSARDMEPSRAVLYDYGNVSSSTTCKEAEGQKFNGVDTIEYLR